MSDASDAFKDAIKGLKESDPDRDFIVISNGINRQLHYRLSRLLEQKKTHKKCTVFLTTNGGDADGAFRIGRCLRHHYRDHLRVAVPSWCKSAGTLIAIAADELAIGDLGELGPLDVQVHKGSELYERSSSLDIVEALGHISSHTKMIFHEMLKDTRHLGLSTKLAAEMAAQVSSAVAAPLFSQVDPMRLGEMQRAVRIAFEYGERLNKYSKNLKPEALSTLVQGYPTHGFVIDRKEATELFERVFPLNDAEQTFANVVWPVIQYQAEMADVVPDNSDETPEDQNDESPPTSNGKAAGAQDATEPAGAQGDGDNSAPGEKSVRVRASSARKGVLTIA